MESNKSKRVVQFEIGDNVKKLTIMGENKDQQVVMREVLGEDELEQAAGGMRDPYIPVAEIRSQVGRTKKPNRPR